MGPPESWMSWTMPQYSEHKLCSLPTSAVLDCTLSGADFQIKRVFISDFSHAVNVVFDYINRGKISVLSGNKEIFLSEEIYFCHFLLWGGLSRWPANSIVAKNSLLFWKVRGDRWYLRCVIHSEGLFGQYHNKYSKKKLPDSHNSTWRLSSFPSCSVI